MRFLYKGIITLTLFIVFSEVQFAQPYIFKTGKDTIDEPDKPWNMPASFNIYKINLRNNQKSKLTTGIGDVFSDNTQTWLAIEEDLRENRYSIRNLINSNKSEYYYCSILPSNMVYSKLHKKLYTIGEMLDETKEVTWMMSRVFGEYYEVLSIQKFDNEEKFIKMDTPHGGDMFLSADETMLYVPTVDQKSHPSVDNKIKLAYISTSTNKIIKKRILKEFGHPDAGRFYLSNGKQGKAIITSFFDDGYGVCFNIYDFDHETSSPFIFHKGEVVPYFTNNGKYLVLAEIVQSNKKDEDVSVYISGRIFIYNVPENKLVKTLLLPSKRYVHSFDNFPDNIYYYNDKTERTITLNIDSLVNNSSAPTDSPKVIMYNLGNSVFTTYFVNGNVKYELGKGYTFIKPAISLENKLIYNEYDENNTLLGVFTFEKGYVNGTYTSNKNKKVFNFSRIDRDPEP